MMKDIYKFETLGARLVYSDTDSIFYLSKKGRLNFDSPNFPVSMGMSYSQYKREYDCPIVAFICLGNKNYCLILEDSTGKLTYIIKVRGFQLKSLLTKNINASLFKQFVLSYFEKGQEMKTHTMQFLINIDKKSKKVKSELMFKQFKVIKILFLNQILAYLFVRKNSFKRNPRKKKRRKFFVFLK